MDKGKVNKILVFVLFLAIAIGVFMPAVVSGESEIIKAIIVIVAIVGLIVAFSKERN